MFQKWLFSLLAIFTNLLGGLQAAVPFTATYQQWIDPSNTFIEYNPVVNGASLANSARVIFIGSEAYSLDGDGQVPTVSEGMGYGLLLAYANNDQSTFDQFLRYILAVANSKGCSLYSSQSDECLTPCPFLMPWLVNNLGEPFFYLPNPNSTAAYFSSGSATDADIQIAWAIYLASQKAAVSGWNQTQFATTAGTLSYQQIFDEMTLQIRLLDVGFVTLRYNPGSQWARAGIKVMYPGYFTPQAFVALDTAPIPSTSTACPVTYPIQSPANSFQLNFFNDATTTVSIDYLGGSPGLTITPSSNFVPKPGNPTGFTVESLKTATAIITNANDGDNFTLQAAHYNSSGFATIRSNYTFTYNGTSMTWLISNGPESAGVSTANLSGYCQSPTTNVANVFLKQLRINKFPYKFSDNVGDDPNVFKNSLATIVKYQTQLNGLLPNVIYYNGNYPQDNFSYIFGYDACRYALWSGGFLQNYSTYNATQYNKLLKSLRVLLKVIEPSIQLSDPNNPNSGTLPLGGINALTNQPLGGYSTPAIPLNATVMTGAYVLGNLNIPNAAFYTGIYNQLSPSVISYSFNAPGNQPQPTDAIGSSSPYYNAAMVLLSSAFINKLL